MSKLLSTAAVGSRSGDDAAEILKAYIETEPVMVLNHALAPEQQTRPKGTGAGDHLIEPK